MDEVSQEQVEDDMPSLNYATLRLINGFLANERQQTLEVLQLPKDFSW